MSYRIEITADTLAELAGKAASLAAKLNTGTATEAPARAVDNGVALTAAPHPVNVAVEVPEDISPAAVETVEVEAPAADVPDFDTVVTPLVLKLVEVKGKPAAQEVLGRFGVVKASQLDSDKWAELVDAINDELAA